MRLIHYIEIRVFCKYDESKNNIIKTLKELIPFNLENEKIKLKQVTTDGFDDKKIDIFSVNLKREKHTNLFLKHIIEKLSNEQKKLLFAQLDSRLDDNLNFYIRLDKTKLQNNEYEIIDSGNCFHLKLSIAAYPHKREVAKTIIKNILK